MTTGADVAAKALEFRDVPFVHAGRDRAVGIDCAGLVILVAQDLGLTDFDVVGYQREPNPEEFRRLLRANMDEVSFASLQLGDVLTFAMPAEQHLGIVVGVSPLKLAHSYQQAGKCVLHALGREWLLRIRGCYRYRGLA